MTPAEHLKLSRASHLRYRAMTIKDEVTDAELVAIVREALTHRLAAHEADPNHVDPEWENDRAPHKDLMKFYDGYTA